jgi:hypothetical protein
LEIRLVAFGGDQLLAFFDGLSFGRHPSLMAGPPVSPN